jgi:hypothetical protein
MDRSNVDGDKDDSFALVKEAVDSGMNPDEVTG